MSTAFLFPGQGSQSVGMLDSIADRPEIAALLKAADEGLGDSISTRIANGPPQDLALTVNTQPAMLLTGMALLTAWRTDGGPEPQFVAGHSLGEYTALTAAGVFETADAVQLVRIRAQAMQDAVPVGAGGMAAILGLSDDDVRKACDRATTDEEIVEAVNFNAPAQVVIAGHTAALDRACAAAKELGAKRALVLPVSAPFHSRLLAPAVQRLKEELARRTLNRPRIDLVNNVDVAIEHEPDRIRDALARQAASPVRWVETVNLLKSRGVDRVVEFGPGKVLCGLVQRIDRSIRTDCVHDAASLASVLESFR